MNWLTWRQYRPQAVAGYGALAVIGAFLALTGLQILHTYDVMGLSRCLDFTGPDCSELASQFRNRYRNMQFFLLCVLLVPVLVGMFWGAPLVALELEHGTHRLVWTQSVTRRRWILSKLAIVGGSALAFSTILSAAVTWWSNPMTKTSWGRLDPGLFDLLGIVPIAYTIFAFALGVAIGTLTRKTLPAVFATLAVYAAVRLPITLFVRKHFMGPKELVYGMFDESPAHALGDWILSRVAIDSTGSFVSEFGGLGAETMASRCPDLLPSVAPPDKDPVIECVQRIGLSERELFHPAERFWTFQAIEAAIFLALTALLVVFIVRRVKRLS